MAKIDEIKEVLNTLRLLFSIGVGLIVVITGSLIAKEQSSNVDIYFWIGLIIDIVLILGLVKLIGSIKRYIEEIKDL